MASRLVQVTTGEQWSGGAGVTRFAYDVASRLTSLALPNGITSTYGYDGASRLLTLSHQTLTQTVAAYTYTVDAAGNWTQGVESLLQPSGSTQSTTITYTYDSLYRLTNATYSAGDVFTYTYDAVGNRLTQTTITNTTVYTYDVANRLINVGGVAQTWDNNGNLTGDGASTYAYDSANRLTSVVQGANTYTFAYNGLGDRMRQTTNGVTTTYTLDLNAPLTQILSDGTNTYLYGPTRIGEQQPGGFAYHLPDALGSARQLANANAQVILTQSYEPFGSVMSKTGSGNTSFGWAGEARDASGLIFLRARYYSPTTGRFFVHDAWPGNTQMPGTLHPYLYGMNNPVMYTDPSGQWCIVGFTWGPGVPCTLQEQADWARKWSAAQRYYNAALGNIQGGVEFGAGFLQEYIDGISVIPVVTLVDAGLCYLVGQKEYRRYSSDAYNAGRLFARGTLYSQAIGETTLGLMGMIGGGGVSLTGGGALAGIPVATLSAVVAAHGALVLTGLAIKERVDPIPNIYFAKAGTGGGSRLPEIPRPGQPTGAGRKPGKPDKGVQGIYEFIDQKTGKWYVGRSEDLRTRLRFWISKGNLASYDDAVWTEIPKGYNNLRMAEAIRIEQVAKEVGGRANMANSTLPGGIPVNPETAQQWIINHPNIPGWPNWLYWPR